MSSLASCSPLPINEIDSHMCDSALTMEQQVAIIKFEPLSGLRINHLLELSVE